MRHRRAEADGGEDWLHDSRRRKIPHAFQGPAVSGLSAVFGLRLLTGPSDNFAARASPPWSTAPTPPDSTSEAPGNMTAQPVPSTLNPTFSAKGYEERQA